MFLEVIFGGFYKFLNIFNNLYYDLSDWGKLWFGVSSLDGTGC